MQPSRQHTPRAPAARPERAAPAGGQRPVCDRFPQKRRAIAACDEAANPNSTTPITRAANGQMEGSAEERPILTEKAVGHEGGLDVTAARSANQNSQILPPSIICCIANPPPSNLPS